MTLEEALVHAVPLSQEKELLLTIKPTEAGFMGWAVLGDWRTNQTPIRSGPHHDPHPIACAILALQGLHAQSD